MMPSSVTLTVLPDDAGLRLDRFLAQRLADLSRSRIQALLEAGEVSRDGREIADASGRVKPGQAYVVRIPAPVPATPLPEPIPLEILFEDEHLIVLEKPAGLVVHPAPGHPGGTLVNALLAHCAGSLSGIGGVARPGIVHRLDRDVSGVMVAAKHDRAHIRLSAQFSVHSVERRYEAIVFGRPPQPLGTIEGAIGRHPRDRKRMAVVPGGKPATTHFRTLRIAGSGVSWLELELSTGRTHQIRVHLQTLGLGIVGDPVYRPRRLPMMGEVARAQVAALQRIALHARVLGFEHPISQERLRFERVPPLLFHDLFSKFDGEPV